MPFCRASANHASSARSAPPARRRSWSSPRATSSYGTRTRARYPWVRLFTTWNEANFPSAQPTGRYPVRTAQFYRMLRRECAGGKCTVLTADFRADGGAHSARWLRTFKRHIGRGPHIWGLVSHPDVNRLSTARTRWTSDAPPPAAPSVVPTPPPAPPLKAAEQQSAAFDPFPPTSM